MSRIQRRLVICSLILFAGIIAYGNSLWNDFAFDDISVIAENPMIGDLSRVPDLFTQKYFSMSGEKTYRPLVTLTYMIDYQIWGNEKAFGYHCSGLLYHLLTAFVLFILLKRFINNESVACIAAILFAIHPLMTEAVCSITFREDVLCCLFFLLACYGYIMFRKTEKPFYVVLCSISFLLSLFAKEMGFAFIPLIVLYELFYFEKPFKWLRFISLHTSLLIVSIFFIVLRFGIMSNPSDGFSVIPFSVKTFFESLFTYWKLYFFPIELRALYYHTHLFVSWRDYVLLVIALLCGTAIVVIASDRKKILFLILASAVGFGPVSNIYPLRHLFAERYTYLPAFGILVVLALMFVTPDSRRQRLSLVLFIVVSMLFTARTMVRCAVWKDNYTLWLRTAQKSPWLAEANYSLGHACQQRGDIDKAIIMYRRALARRDNYYDALVNLGVAYAEKGLHAESIPVYLDALRIKPNDYTIHYNLGIALDKINNDEDALQHLYRARDIEPYNPDVYNALAAFYVRRNDPEQAASYWGKSIEVDPSYLKGYSNLGSLYANEGDIQKARYYWSKALSIDPHYTSVFNKLRQLESEHSQTKE